MPPCAGASLLAKNPKAPRSFRQHALSLTFFASKLAPTEDLSRRHQASWGLPRAAVVRRFFDYFLTLNFQVPPENPRPAWTFCSF
ncbi:hypothetical protein EXW72_01950 [Pseudomonas sp. BCA14]|nr:hypothetical protein EXW70_01740 [Pseudomonas sp. JMN1]TFF16036.1 hypothetical protein EXW71_07300 [Pseudomonas sp. BCA17]TFF29972.1 hypothetical protein EXW73_06535 [Pseudomonas sp. BCA13]TFF30814.1 hypothetical protein EXW72_01950 [Pseudomonas sp. BCA14]